MGQVSFIILFCVLYCYLNTVVSSLEREITTKYNPSCDIAACQKGINGSFANLAYITAKGPNDTLRYLISSIGSPSIIVLRHLNDKNVKLNVNWTKLLSNDSSDVKKSIEIVPKPEFAFAVVYDKILEYNDVNDSADLSKFNNLTKFYKIHELKDYDWLDLSDSYSENDNTVSLKTVPDTPRFTKNGSISFEFELFKDYGRGEKLPHLQHSANSTQLSFAVKNFVPSFSKSRLSLEMLMVYTGNQKDNFTLEYHKSLDDEHTPGVFKIVNWIANLVTPEKLFGYMQWKPVCYNNEDRSMQTATYAKEYSLTKVKAAPIHNIAYAYFGDDYETKQFPMVHTNVSFGLSGDGFYNGTRYLEWTSTVGFGEVPEETISTVVIIIIAVGLGIPFLLILFGGIYICAKKKKTQTLSVYAPIQ